MSIRQDDSEYYVSLLRPKKDVCLPFLDPQKISGNKGQLFFFFIIILNFAFLSKKIQ